MSLYCCFRDTPTQDGNPERELCFCVEGCVSVCYGTQVLVNTLYQNHSLACISSLEAGSGKQSPIFSYSLVESVAQNPVALWSSFNLLKLIFRVNDTTCSKCSSALTDHGSDSSSALTIANLGGICRHFWDSSSHFSVAFSPVLSSWLNWHFL